MQQFEIKIFANPSGFQELKLNNNAENLFQKEIIEKRNFDGDYGTFREGTFSVLFTPKSFIIDYIFNTVADANFRDPQTHIAIAIERGYMLKNAYQVFTSLRKEFNLIAAEAKVNIITALHSKGGVFNSIVENNIEFAPDQFRISIGEKTVIKRALASYETEEQLNSLLEEPNRLKFDSYDLVYFLKKIDASELYKKESIKKYYAPIKMDDEDFNFSVSYEVIFPDNSKVTIKSRYDEIDHTCTKMYYKSERFYGTLNEHMEDWKVTQSEDRTKFYIGKELTPEKKELRILCYDSGGKLVNTPSSLRFDIGKFSHQRGVLVLTGEEIGTTINYHLDDPSIEIKQVEYGDGFISFEIIYLYVYNVSKVFDYVREKTGETVTEIKIYQTGKNVPLATLTKKYPCCYNKIGPDNMEYEIPETKKYSSIRVGFTNNCLPLAPQFQKKDTADIELIIMDESIVRNLKKRPVYCRYKNANEEDEEKYTLKKTFNEDGHLVLKEQPFGKFLYKIDIHGFRTIENVIILSRKDKTKQIKLDFKKTPWNKILSFLNRHKGNVAIFLIGLVLGGILRPYIGISQNNETDNEEKNKLISDLESDTLELNQKIRDLQSQVYFLDSQIENYKTTIKDAAELARTEAISEPKPPVVHPEIVKEILTKLSNENIEYIKKTREQNIYYYKPLSDEEKSDFDIILDNENYYNAFLSITDRKSKFRNANTFRDAINILKEMNGE